MPVIRFSATATSTDALSNRLFNVIPSGGALVSLWASCATATDTISLSAGNQQIFTTLSPNIELAANRIVIEQDQLVFQESIRGPVQLFLPITAVTTRVNILINLAYLQ